MPDPNPKIENLIQGLEDISIGDFLKSKEFKRYAIKIKLHEEWNEVYQRVKKNRSFYSVGMDHEKYDQIDTMITILNQLIEYEDNQFFPLFHDLLVQCVIWSKKEVDTSDFIEDLELIGCPTKLIENIKLLSDNGSLPVPKSEIPSSTWNATKLQELISKMDDSIEKGEFNLTLTYSYSCLEGLFKAFVEKNIPNEIGETKINRLSKIVKDYILNEYRTSNESAPEQMINLIGTITNSISNTRNSFSDSHFDGDSDLWLAEFARDCTNSVGRFILKYLE